MLTSIPVSNGKIWALAAPYSCLVRWAFGVIEKV